MVVIVVGLCRLNESEAITVDGDDEAKSCLQQLSFTEHLQPHTSARSDWSNLIGTTGRPRSGAVPTE